LGSRSAPDLRGRWTLNVVLRSTGLGLLIMLVILLPIYLIFGLGYVFWIALAVCLIFSFWGYAAYKKLYSAVLCPKCGLKMKYGQVRIQRTCPKCGRDLQDLLEK
jgi:hypothetical protein